MSTFKHINYVNSPFMKPEISALASTLPSDLISKINPLGLELVKNIEPEKAVLLLNQLLQNIRETGAIHQSTLSWLGDAIVSLKKLRRGQLAEYAAQAGISQGTLRNVKMVCTRIPLSCRHDKVSWSRHMEIGLATDDPVKIKAWLELAHDQNLSVRDLRLRIRSELKEKDSVCYHDDPFVPSAKIMRELNASVHVLEFHRATWSKWGPVERAHACKRLAPLLEFVASLKQGPAGTREAA